MGRRSVDNIELERWRALPSVDVLASLANYAKQDASFVPRSGQVSIRWHINAGSREFELLCTGSKFWDTRANRGGGGALDLAMHLHGVGFKQAAQLLRSKGL
ncbi:hypothetical protein FGJ01_13825 [Hydrogenophaga intermedia]|nr:hypothetical protein FGJ01_13825 [Hydrogenophaga intermedia]